MDANDSNSDRIVEMPFDDSDEDIFEEINGPIQNINNAIRNISSNVTVPLLTPGVVVDDDDGHEEAETQTSEVVTTQNAKRRCLPEKRIEVLPATRDIGTCTGTRLSRYTNSDEDDDEGMKCAICMEVWQNTGEHRCVALRCGHLFGESCILRWIKSLQPGGDRRHRRPRRCCPQCKQFASVKDIVPIYAKCVKVVDNSAETDLRARLEEEVYARRYYEAKCEVLKSTCGEYWKMCKTLETQMLDMTAKMRAPAPEQPTVPRRFYKLSLDHQIIIHSNGGYRLLKFYVAH